MQQSLLSVPTLVKAMFRKAQGPDGPHLYGGALPAETSTLREELVSRIRQDDLVVRFLVEMDKKLDTLLALSRRESLSADFPFAGRVLELSGNSLRLECSQALAQDTCLEVLLQLEEFPSHIVSVIARVREVLDPPAGSEERRYLADITDVHAEDREHIIRFVFSEERKRIRRQKDSEN